LSITGDSRCIALFTRAIHDEQLCSLSDLMDCRIVSDRRGCNMLLLWI
jgi:hypothetical protein